MNKQNIMNRLKGFPLSMEQKQELLNIIKENSGGGSTKQGSIEGAELGYPNLNVIKQELMSGDTIILRYTFNGISVDTTRETENEIEVFAIVNTEFYNNILDAIKESGSIFIADEGGVFYQPAIINKSESIILQTVNILEGTIIIIISKEQ